MLVTKAGSSNTEELDRGDTLAARAETGLRQNTTTRIASVHHRILEFIPLFILDAVPVTDIDDNSAPMNVRCQ